jgi:glycosyltransferase involved in cell wall biosynthesis
MPQHELVPYYSAADVYLFTRFYSNRREEKLEEFMGFGAAPIESMACGTPVVGTNLRHFLGTKKELSKIGKMPKDIEDAVKCVTEVLEHPELYRNCRQIARKYYSWENVVDRLIAIYDELFAEYYK